MEFLKNYEEFVLSRMSEMSMESQSSQLATAGLGLAGEAGEFADIVKKLLFHGKPLDEETKQKMIKELGDIQFYVAFAARIVCGVGLEEIIEINTEKLTERYKSGKFTVEEFLKKESENHGS